MTRRVHGTVLVAGSVNVDLVVRSATLPGPGETVIGGRFSSGPGGKGGNQAAAAARLGARTFFAGRVGDDDFGRRAREDLCAAGVDVTHLHDDPAQPTGVALILVDDGGENAISVASGANAAVTPEQVVAAVDAVDASTDPGPCPVLLTNLEIPVDAVRAGAVRARELGWEVVLNPAPARPLPPGLLAAVDVLTPNAVEAPALHPGGAAGLLAAGAGAVVVTHGGEGVQVHLPDRPLRGLPAVAVEVVDTTGAGDAFTAALAWALAGGHPLEAAVRSGIAAGALSVTREGARASLDVEEVLRLAGVG